MKNEITVEAIRNRQAQGDVILFPVEKLPEGAVEQDFKKKTLQESEVSGHHHRFRPDDKVALFMDPKSATNGGTITPNLGKYILVYEESTFFHGKEYDLKPSARGTGDHDAQVVKPGIYKVEITREYDYSRRETARVRD